MHIHYASSPHKIVDFTRTILSATPSKTTATETGYIEAKAFIALAQWGEWIVARELAHLKHIHSPHMATAGCQAFANTKTQRSVREKTNRCKSGGGGGRTRVQTRNPKAFYTLSRPFNPSTPARQATAKPESQPLNLAR